MCHEGIKRFGGKAPHIPNSALAMEVVQLHILTALPLEREHPVFIR
jgi:hypothetical protein